MTAAGRFFEFLLLDDEEISQEHEVADVSSTAWFQHNEGIPFEKLVADLEFSMGEIRSGNNDPAA